MNISRSFLCVIAMVLGTAASAQDVLYDCDISDRDPDVGWISPRVALILGADGQATAIDTVILHFIKSPLPARVKKNGSKLNFSWRIKGARDSNNQLIPTFSYRATVDSKTNAILLSANPSGYAQQWSGRGTCKIRKDAKLPKGLR